MKEFNRKKEEIFHLLLKLMVILGAVAYIPSLLACIHDELYILASIDTLAYALILAVFFIRRFTFTFRLYSIVLITLVLGAAVLFQTGTDGAGYIWLLAGVVFSALFGRIAIIITAIAFSQGIMWLYGFLSFYTIIQPSSPIVGVFAISANLLLISLTLALITYNLLKVLRTENEVQEDILKLLHHRIKNNLQSFESIVALDHVAENESDPLHRHVRAVSAANELLLSEPDGSELDLGELLFAICDPAKVKIRKNEGIKIRPEKLTEIAIGFSDLFVILNEYAPLYLDVSEKIEIQGSASFPEIDEINAQLEKSFLPSILLEKVFSEASDAGSNKRLVVQVP